MQYNQDAINNMKSPVVTLVNPEVPGAEGELKNLSFIISVCLNQVNYLVLVLEMLLDMILKLSLGKVPAELLLADGALFVALVNVLIDVLLDLQEVLVGELHLTDRTPRHGGRDLWLGETVGSRHSGAQLGDGGGGRVNVLRHQGGW